MLPSLLETGVKEQGVLAKEGHVRANLDAFEQLIYLFICHPFTELCKNIS